jgi:hypothetical protein
MIISHEHRLIFLKTLKTAGTSFEIALSKFCGPDDIITPITAGDESERSARGYRGPQHYKDPVFRYLLKRGVPGLLEAVAKRKMPRRFWNHIPARIIATRVPEAIWNGYSKLTIVRNPWDRIVSHYFYSTGGKDVGFRSWLLHNLHEIRRNYWMLVVDDKFVPTIVMRFEKLPSDLRKLEEQIPGLAGIADTFGELRAKASYRPSKGASVQELFHGNEDLKTLVEILCREEIELFGYSFPAC